MKNLTKIINAISCLTVGMLIFVLNVTGDIHWLWSFPAWAVFALGWIDLIEWLQSFRRD